MSHRHSSIAGAALLIGAVLTSTALDARGGVVGIAPLTRPGSPDFSQIYADNTFSPFSGHASWWGDPAIPGTCRMCGPTTAADTAFWFADLHGDASRLSQVKMGSDWVEATPGNVIEQFALAVGFYEGWDPQATAFPGTSADQNYIKGQADYYSQRGLNAAFDYLPVAAAGFDNFFDRMVVALLAGQGVELSNTGHWFSVAGARTDEFDDNNGNGFFDAGDKWITDYDNDGQFDRYLWVNNPWPGHASQGWDSYYTAGGNYYLAGDDRRLDSAVFVSLVPEPGAAWLALTALGLALRTRSTGSRTE